MGKIEKRFKKGELIGLSWLASHQNPLNTRILSRLRIDKLVTHHVGMFGTDVVLIHQLLDHLSGRFSAMAILIRTMRANRKILKGLELVNPQVVLELSVNNINRFQREVAPPHSRLVSYHKKFKAEFLKKMEGL